LVVSLAGDAPYSSIAAAVAAAPVNGRITVKPGVYRESVMILKPVEIVIDPNAVAGAAVIEGQSEAALTINSPSARINGLAFRIRTSSAAGSPCAVDVVSGAPVFEDCDFGEAREECINIRGAGVSATFRKCRIHSGGSLEARVSEKASAVFDSCTFLSQSKYGVNVIGGSAVMTSCIMRGPSAGHETYGIVAKEGSTLSMTKCDIGPNLYVGIYVEDSKADISQCHIHDAALIGFEAAPSGEVPALRDCEINNCGKYGLYVHRSRTGATDCHIHDCDRAIYLTQSAFLTAKRCSWDNCSGYGAYIDDNAVGYFSNAVVHDIHQAAIYTINSGNAVVSNSDISKCGADAVRAVNAGLTIQDCKLRDFAQGAIHFEKKSKGIIKRITIENSTYTAVLIQDNSDVAVDACIIKSTGDNGFEVTDSRVTINNSSAVSAKNYGVLARENANVTVAHTDLNSNKSGVRTMGRPVVTLEACSLMNNVEWGIDSQGWSVTVTNCTFAKNGSGDVRP
jgi:hypothetical protein